MKKLLPLFLSAALLPLYACQQSEQACPSSARIRIQVSGTRTKATGLLSNDSTTEAKLNTLDVFIFNGDVLDGRGSVQGTNSLEVDCSAGERDIYCVVNGPDLSAVSSKAALFASIAPLRESVDHFVMFSFSDGEGRTIENGDALPIQVKRCASRIVVHAVKNGMLDAALAADFHLDALYLTNVAGDVRLDGDSTYEIAQWYNRQGFQQSNNLGTITYDAIDRSLSSGETDQTAHFFYAMPNAFDAAVGGAWTPRRSKLLVKATMAGQVYYYPITLPALESNKSYEIQLLSLIRPGNKDSDPDPEEDAIEPTETIGQSFNISVSDWDVILLNGNGEICL